MLGGAGGGIPNVKSPSDLFSFSHVRNSARLDDSRLGALRDASKSTEGLMATVAEQLGKKRTRRPVPSSGDDRPDPALRVGAEVHGRIGIGLPMSNIYARSTILSFTLRSAIGLLVLKRVIGTLEDLWTWCLWMAGVRVVGSRLSCLLSSA